jgi:hypothetical protein
MSIDHMLHSYIDLRPLSFTKYGSGDADEADVGGEGLGSILWNRFGPNLRIKSNLVKLKL